MDINLSEKTQADYKGSRGKSSLSLQASQCKHLVKSWLKLKLAEVTFAKLTNTT